jgi:hypothetical protein
LYARSCSASLLLHDPLLEFTIHSGTPTFRVAFVHVFHSLLHGLDQPDHILLYRTFADAVEFKPT